jgi:hypothetical protein
VIASRIFAVLSAILLITAVALATFGVRSLSLSGLLGMIGPRTVDGMRGWVTRLLGDWTWVTLVDPFMIRPSWLVPAFLGLVCSGLAVTLSYRGKASRSERRGPRTPR